MALVMAFASPFSPPTLPSAVMALLYSASTACIVGRSLAHCMASCTNLDALPTALVVKSLAWPRPVRLLAPAPVCPIRVARVSILLNSC